MNDLQKKAIEQSKDLVAVANKELGLILMSDKRTVAELSAEMCRTNSEIYQKVFAPLRDAQGWLEAVLE